MLLIALSACNVTDAPETIEQLVVYGFAGFDEGAENASTAASGLRPLAAAFGEQLAQGMRVDDLTQADVEAAGITTELEGGIVGVAATVAMAASVEDLVWAWSHPHMDTFLDVTTGFEIRTEYGDRDGFIAGDRDTYAYDGWRRVEMGGLGNSEQEFNRAFQRTVLDDGSTAVVVRDMAPEGAEMDTSWVRVGAQFSFSVFYDEGDDALRLDAFWIDAEAIGLELPDYFALDLAVNQMNATAERVDAFISEQ